MSPLTPRLDRVQHLGLYTAFHRSAKNRVVHAIALPMIFFTGAVALAWLAPPSSSGLAHPATAVVLAMCLLLGLVDPIGGLLTLAWTLGLCAAAGTVRAHTPVAPALALAGVLHGLAWFVAVNYGHVSLEPNVHAGHGEEDSNVYFRRRYFLARDVGTPVGLVDGLVQFSIAALSLSQDLVEVAGLRRGLTAQIGAERERVLTRLAASMPPFAPHTTGTAQR